MGRVATIGKNRYNCHMLEYDIQRAIIMALRGRGVFVYSTPNELLGRVQSKGGYGRMQRAVQAGLLSGVADLTAVLPGRIIYMEVKTAKGVQSDAQKYFQERVTALGHQYHIVRSVEDAMQVLGL